MTRPKRTTPLDAWRECADYVLEMLQQRIRIASRQGRREAFQELLDVKDIVRRLRDGSGVQESRQHPNQSACEQSSSSQS